MEASSQIRAFEKESGNPAAVIVALTTHAINEFRDRAYANGMNDYLCKPINTQMLERILNKYFA